MKKANGIIVILYSILVLAGGIIGFVKANSVPSLIMGTAFGVALFGNAIAMLKHSRIGTYLAAVLTLILTIFFAFRFAKSLLFMPAGLMCVAGLVVLAALTTFVLAKRRSQYFPP